MKNVLIRADGSSLMGLGHLTRCLALANMLKDVFSITFVCKEIPLPVEKEIRNSPFSLLKIKDENTFFQKIKTNTIVILDGYHFDISYQKKIKEQGCKLVCIDDLHNREFAADLIINHAPGVKPQDYPTLMNTKFALGIEYALLRPAFLEQAKKERSVTEKKTVLICFGGSDPKNLTETTLQIVKEFTQFTTINVVTGSAYSNTAGLTKLVNDDSRIHYYTEVNENTMVEIMVSSDIAIVPSSGILFEVLAAGCLAVSGHYADNQIAIYSGFNNLDAIYGVNDFKDLKNNLSNFLKTNITKQKDKIIDGQSGNRLLEKFKLL